jgi:hypothetical protein
MCKKYDNLSGHENHNIIQGSFKGGFGSGEGFLTGYYDGQKQRGLGMLA